MNHQRLRCYEVLLGTAKRVPGLTGRIPRGNGYIIDQLKRALASAILNLSEGNGRASGRERARFFDISLASIAESSSAIDVMQAYRLISLPDGDDLKSQLNIAYAMIFNLKKSAI